MPIFADNGVLLVDGAALKGCCCGPKVFNVTIRCDAVIGSAQTIAGTGHDSNCVVTGRYDGCGNIEARKQGATWSEYSSPPPSEDSCGRAFVKNGGTTIEAGIPFESFPESGFTNVLLLRFVSTKRTGSIKSSFTWSIDIPDGITAQIEVYLSRTGETRTIPLAAGTTVFADVDLETDGDMFGSMNAHLYFK